MFTPNDFKMKDFYKFMWNNATTKWAKKLFLLDDKLSQKLFHVILL